MAEALNPELVMPLRVNAARLVADDIREFELVDPNGAELPAFTPGAHLLIQTPSGVTRRYSLSSAPSEREHYVIAVKREAGGRGGSISVVDGINEGDLIQVSVPRNEFELNESAPSYLFIAGGIGITPIRSMIRHVEETTGKPFKLYYLSRQPEMTAYRDEYTAPEYKGKAVVHHDYGDPDKSLDLWTVLEKPKGHVYCCGPKPLMDAVRDMTGHWSASAVHFEDFGAGKVARAADDKPFVVRYGEGGAPIDVGANQSILEALRSQGHRIPSSCESGTCGSCRLKLLSGEADHRDFVLSDDERLSQIMVCVSRAHSPELTVAP
jgi:phthalate 4,5-dioxygenase reductase subunit